MNAQRRQSKHLFFCELVFRGQGPVTAIPRQSSLLPKRGPSVRAGGEPPRRATLPLDPGASHKKRCFRRQFEGRIAGVPAALAVLAALASPAPAAAQKNSCVECHEQLDGNLKAPVVGFATDVHRQFGLSCADCHGGNPAEDDITLAKDKTFKGAPSKPRIPEFCGGCHSNSVYMKRFNPTIRVDQLEIYWTSKHGELLRKNDTRVAVCTDCHGVHGIQTPALPKSMIFPWNIPQTCGRCHADADYMKPYGIPTDQVAKYKESVHATALYDKKDLSAPACNDCHGNHGAVPPEVTSIAFVCRRCHPSPGELFSRSPHKAAFDSLGVLECDACHGNHNILPPSDDMLAGGKNDICSQCHEAGSPPDRVGREVRRRLGFFIAAFEHDRGLLDQAEKKGVEVSEASFRLQDANSALIEARNLTHGLSLPDIEARLGDGDKTLEAVRVMGEAALREARFRKAGLVVATFFLLLLALALFLKIRDLREGRPRS
jgi:predicted CXXCH cytochrome family protein